MTEPRHDNHSTEFGLWLRTQEKIDSKDGYVATNIDYVWMNYKTGDWMLIEEKRFQSFVKPFQQRIFSIIHKVCMLDKKYKGFHLLSFEKTSPDDGKMWLDKKLINKDDLINFLQFKGAS